MKTPLPTATPITPGGGSPAAPAAGGVPGATIVRKTTTNGRATLLVLAELECSSEDESVQFPLDGVDVFRFQVDELGATFSGKTIELYLSLNGETFHASGTTLAAVGISSEADVSAYAWGRIVNIGGGGGSTKIRVTGYGEGGVSVP